MPTSSQLLARVFNTRAPALYALTLACALVPSTALLAQPATTGGSTGSSGGPFKPAIDQAIGESQKAQRQAAASTLDINLQAHAEEMIEKAENYLRSRQDPATGGWSAPKPDKDGKTSPQLPGISALIVNALALNPKIDTSKDQTILAGTKFLLNYQQPDGGIYDRMLPCYNTALGISALSQVKTPQAKEAVARALPFLRALQWSEESDPKIGGSEAAKPVQKDHPYYGGVGYGRSGRPDNSNLNIFVQALHDAGVSADDPAVQRALVFLKRTQMDERVNDMPFAKGSRQGGFVYSTAENAQSVDAKAGQSMAGSTEETLSDGTKASRLRAYGSMTYAGFKTYIYAQLPKDDPRVAAAFGWIQRNYSVQENPGMGTDGLYYYFVVFSRALNAAGIESIATLKPDGSATGDKNAWRADLINRLSALQTDDGSFKSVDDRWMENNPELITAYALIALRQCVK